MTGRCVVGFRLFLVLLLIGEITGDKNYKEEEKKPNILWILIDDVSTERFPEWGNTALQGKLPGLEELKADGAVYYSHFYAPSSICAPSQVALFSGMDPANIGGHHQFSTDIVDGKANYATVPPPEVEFVPEKLRSLGYYSTGAGKLDYQVGNVMPTFYNEITAGGFSDVSAVVERTWLPAIAQRRPFYGMINMMDNHQLISTFSREAPIPLTDITTGRSPTNLPFGPFGYSTPLALLYNTGPNGMPKPEVTASQDLDLVDVVGYRGDFDESTLSHANGGVPQYLPDEVGVRSILAREYDLIRNIDYRISQIITRLKELDVYDDTLIVVFGDHGSGTYKAKILIQPQSIRTPLWIKYPKDFPLSDSVKSTTNDYNQTYNVDDRMAGITDLYPTTLSVLGLPPESYMTGHALAGIHEQKKERKAMYGLVARIGGFRGLKSFVAYTKSHFYQYHALTEEAIAKREAKGLDDPSLISRARFESIYASRFDVFSAAPIFDRLHRLMLVNADNDEYPNKYRFISADEASPPSEVLFDLTVDPDGTDNLLVEYTYQVGQGLDLQPWGNQATNVTLSYSDVSKKRLDKTQKRALKDLRRGLKTWVHSQDYVKRKLDWSEGLFGEENKMARKFWPNGIQPSTDAVSVDLSSSNGNDGDLINDTPGTVFRYSTVSATDRELCEQLGSQAKDEIDVMSPIRSGFDPISNFVSQRNGQTYEGYLYGVGGRDVVRINFIGSTPGCTVFISSNLTFLEVDCSNQAPLVFDSRDSTWDGETWVGVDSETGDWLVDPVLLYDEMRGTWNYAAFEVYFFGPNRDQVYSGLNDDGTPFASVVPSDLPWNIGYNPAPKYFASPNEDVYAIPGRFSPRDSVAFKGWNIYETGSFFRSVNSSPNDDDKGSFTLRLASRSVAPPNNNDLFFVFQSFRYECLPWEVGTKVQFDFDDEDGEMNDLLHVFTQGVRKGYSDSPIKEFLLQKNQYGTIEFV